jgi:hypothetical protein
MDNTTAEYTFLSAFFNVAPSIITTGPKQAPLSPTASFSPDRDAFLELRSSSASDYGGHRIISGSSATFSDLAIGPASKEEQATYDALWKQIFDPVLEYCKVKRLLLLIGLHSHLAFSRRLCDQFWNRSHLSYHC